VSGTIVLVVAKETKVMLLWLALRLRLLLHPKIIGTYNVKTVLLGLDGFLSGLRSGRSRRDNRHVRVCHVAAYALGILGIRVAQEVPHAPPAGSGSRMRGGKLRSVRIGRKGIGRP
jgi:hypothetical protein